MLFIFSSPPFYTKFVQLPKAGYELPHHIRHNPKLWPYFKDSLGAIDGSHIHCAPPSINRPFFRNRKGFISQNCLFACSFSLHFVYSLTGWEGSATDARLWENSQSRGLIVPEGRYYLADAGFPFHVTNFLFCTSLYAITFKSGAVQMSGNGSDFIL
jgi:hypothetical protein